MKANIIKRQKREHPLWEVEQKLKGKTNDITMKYLVGIGKFKYDFESKKGKISMIEIIQRQLKEGMKDGIESSWIWEIYANENPKLFTDVIRFKTKKEAEKAIKKYLQ